MERLPSWWGAGRGTDQSGREGRRPLLLFDRRDDLPAKGASWSYVLGHALPAP